MIPARRAGREEGVAYTLAELLDSGAIGIHEVRDFLEHRQLDPTAMAASGEDRRRIVAAWNAAAPEPAGRGRAT
jgi:hypothetical protein